MSGVAELWTVGELAVGDLVEVVAPDGRCEFLVEVSHLERDAKSGQILSVTVTWAPRARVSR